MIDLFIHIFMTSIIPILLLIGGGVLMDKKFHLDLYTLSKLNFYILLPAYVFLALYKAHFDNASLEVSLCGLLILFSGSLIGGLIGKLLGFTKSKIEIFRNSIMFNNCGNIGVAIITFIYTNDPFLVHGQAPYLGEAAASVVALLVIQNIGTNTIGFYQAGLGKYTLRDSIVMVLHMPTVYMVPSALLLKHVPIDLTVIPFWPSLTFFGNAFVAVAMITLGAQISRTPLNFFKWDVMVATFIRLVIGPLLALLIVLTFTIYYKTLPSVSAQTIIIVYSVPTAVNTALIALEMDNHPEFATQIVMATTFFSVFTMPLVVLGAYYLFPLHP